MRLAHARGRDWHYESVDLGGDSAPDHGDPPQQQLLDALAAVTSDVDTHGVLEHIAASAGDLTDARAVTLGILGRGGTFSDVVTHGSSTDVPDALRVPISVRGAEIGRLQLADKRGGRPFTRKDEQVVQALGRVAGLAIENAGARAQSERRRRWLELFGDLSELLRPPITLADALERIAAAARDASGAPFAAVVQVPEKGASFPAATSGEALDLTEQERVEFDRTVRGVVDTGKVVDLVVRDSWVAMMAPLRAHLALPGVLVIAHPDRSRSEELEEPALLSAFADQAALALDRTQALEEREQMAVVSDRDRIARDLHDVVIQRLFATGLHMQSIRSAAPNEELRKRIDQSVKDLDQTIRDIRGTIFELRTRPRSSVRTEIRDAVRDFVADLGFAPSVETTGQVDVPVEEQVQRQLVSVLREALANVARHAEASQASVELQVTDTHLRLKVSDNGRGMPEDRTEYGLRNARRRAVLLGGDLDLWPNDPQGTIFVWSVPLRAASGAASGQAVEHQRQHRGGA